MSGSGLAGERYGMPRVIEYVQSVEEAYGVSLRFWITLNGSAAAGGVCTVWITASGEAIDLIAPQKLSYSLEIKDGETYAVGEAVYYCALYYERLIASVREPLGPRPSL